MISLFFSPFRFFQYSLESISTLFTEPQNAGNEWVDSANLLEESLPEHIEVEEPKKISLEEQNAAAALIQKTFRIHQAKQREIQERENLMKRERAATLIQKTFRQYIAENNQSSSLLPLELFQQAKALMQSVDIRQFPRAANGKTPVYFPPALPIIFKHSQHPQTQERVKKMNQARKLCAKNFFTKLTIPKARIYGEFIIECRVPIERTLTQKKQIGLYFENQEKFTKAIEEFTAFLCLSHLDDISGYTNDPCKTLCKTAIGRYDNVALYLDDDGEGKIGLIDLEIFNPEKDLSHKNIVKCCVNAVRLFPLHLDQILSIAKTFDPTIELARHSLKQEQADILEYFETIYINHRRFTQTHDILCQNPDQPISLPEPDFNLLSNSVFDNLISYLPKLLLIKTAEDLLYYNMMENSNLSSFQIELFAPEHLKKAPQIDEQFSIDTLNHLRKQELPRAINALMQEIHGLLTTQLKTNESGSKITSYQDLLSIRTIIFDKQSGAYAQLKKSISNELPSLDLSNDFQKEYLTASLLDHIFSKLKTLDKIAYYNPKFGLYPNHSFCIFC